MANLKVRSRCKGCTVVRGPGPTTYVAGRSSEVQLSQRVDAREIRSSSRWERLVAVRICERIRRVERATGGVGHVAGSKGYRGLAVATDSRQSQTRRCARDGQRFGDTDQQHASPEVIRGSTESTGRYAGDSEQQVERLVAVRICELGGRP
jgi:hypothetical protein